LAGVWKRPALIALLCLITGILTYKWFPGLLFPGILLIIAAIALTCQWLPMSAVVRWIPLAGLIALIGAWRTVQVTPHFDGSLITSLEAQVLPITVQGTVARDPLIYRRGSSTVLDNAIVIIHGSEIPLDGKVTMSAYQTPVNWSYGDRIQVWGRMSRPNPRRNPGGVDWAEIYHRNGIIARLVPFSEQDITIIGSGNKSWLLTSVVYPLRNQIISQIHRWFPTSTQPLISALLVGEREQLDPELVEATRRSGTAHLIVISGFHVGVIALVLLRLFYLMRCPFPLQLILTFLSIILFAMIAECRPPVLRAVIMAIVLGGSFLFRRSWDPWNTLAAAAFLILLVRPHDLRDSSFQLSFAAVAAIALFYPAFNRFLLQYGWVHRLRQIPMIGRPAYGLILIAICAQIGTLPIIAADFGRIPTLGVLSTVLGAPLIMLIVPFSIIVVIIGAMGIPQASWLAITVDRLALLFQELTLHISGISFSSIKMGGVSYAAVIGLFILAYLIWNLRRRWAKWGIAITAVLFGNVAVWSGGYLGHDVSLEVTFLDVGQGAAAVIRSADGKSLLVDGGPLRDEWDSGARVIIPCLESYDIDTLDAIIVTHDDNDHIGGIISVLEKYPVRQVYWNGLEGDDETYLRFRQALETCRIEPQKLQAGQTLPGFDAIPVWILHPDSLFLEQPVSSNNASVVIQIRAGDINFLLPGDIELSAETRLLRYGELLQSNVLLVPHHGSASSSSLHFLKAVNPQIAVISVGTRNPYGIPASNVLERLNLLECQVERTDITGAVVLRTDGRRLWKYNDWR
jgi:competence protein ComEC